MQEILVSIIVGAALIYLGVLGYRQFFSKNEKCDGCAMGKAQASGEKKA
jgi:hypothetical protein